MLNFSKLTKKENAIFEKTLMTIASKTVRNLGLYLTKMWKTLLNKLIKLYLKFLKAVYINGELSYIHRLEDAVF